MSLKSMREEKRNAVIAGLMEYLKAAGEDVELSNANEFNLPIILADGSEDWVVVKVSIPTGTREGEAYDGYEVRDDYQMKAKQRADKAAELAKKKQAKIEADAKKRAERAAVKAAKEAKEA